MCLRSAGVSAFSGRDGMGLKILIGGEMTNCRREPEGWLPCLLLVEPAPEALVTRPVTIPSEESVITERRPGFPPCPSSSASRAAVGSRIGVVERCPLGISSEDNSDSSLMDKARFFPFCTFERGTAVFVAEVEEVLRWVVGVLVRFTGVSILGGRATEVVPAERVAAALLKFLLGRVGSTADEVAFVGAFFLEGVIGAEIRVTLLRVLVLEAGESACAVSATRVILCTGDVDSLQIERED